MSSTTTSTLITCATHGHETLGVRAVRKLLADGVAPGAWHWRIGNPRAYRAGVAFCEKDLNRVFPGQVHSATYEERRAGELRRIMARYTHVIDVHATSTTTSLRDAMVIVTRWDASVRTLVRAIGAPHVLIMRHNATGALITHARVGVALEFGDSASRAARDAVCYGIAALFVRTGALRTNPYPNPWRQCRQQVYEVYDVLQKPHGDWVLAPSVHNFAPLQCGALLARERTTGRTLRAPEDFIPILFGENRYETIFGFRAQQVL